MDQFLSNIIQIGVIVSDAEATVQNLERLLGWRPSVTRETMRIPGRTYRGAAEDFACRMYFYPFSKIELEIIQPLCGRSCWNDYLSAYGNGIHHLLFDLSDSATAVERLTAHGIEIEQRGRALPYGEHAFWAYLRSQEQLGFTLELTNRSEFPQSTVASIPLQGPFANLQGVSIAIRNLERTVQAYRKILGWTPAGDPYRIFGDRYQGRESNALSGAVVYPFDTLDLELIRPACGSSCAATQIADCGEGVLCINFEIGGPDDIRVLTDQGVSILEQGHTLMDRRMIRWVILDTKALFGFSIRALFR